MPLKNKQLCVVICGATGFIGRNLVEALSKNMNLNVVAIYNNKPPFQIPNVTWKKANLLEPKEVEHALLGGDVVIQAAAVTDGILVTQNHPELAVASNAILNSLVFFYSSKLKIRHVIFFSCTVMYPNSRVPLKEEDFDANANIYSTYYGVGWTKVYLEKMCDFYSRLGETKFTAIRHSNVYGPWDKFFNEKGHMFPSLMSKIILAEESIEIWGDGKLHRDLIYVSDLVRLVELIMEKQDTKFEIFNAGGKHFISIDSLVDLILKSAKKELKKIYLPHMPQVYFEPRLDSSKAKRILGFEQSVSLEQGIILSLQFLENERLSI